MSERHAGSRVGSLKWWLALPIAALGGFALDAAAPGLGWWPLAIPGAALMLLAMWQQRPAFGLLVGFVAGASFWMPHISWLTLYLGPIPWLGLCGAMVLWFTLMGGLVGSGTRGFAILRDHSARPAVRALLAAAQAVTAAGLWVAREQLQGAWPYGGFAWGRLAHTQASSPLGDLASWMGFVGLTGLLALAAAGIAGAVIAGLEQWRITKVTRAVSNAVAGDSAPSKTRWPRVYAGPLITVAGVTASVLLLACVPPAQLERTGDVRIAAIQGNSQAGIFDDRDSGDVFDDHIAETERLLDRLEASGDSVDLIVWPENSAEYEVRDRVRDGQRIAQLARRSGAAIVVGSVLQDPDGTFTNSSLVWGPQGPLAADGKRARPGEELRYDKRFPVPFAEYMPNREFFHALVPELVELVQLEYEFGTRPAVMEIPIGDLDDASGVSEHVRAGLAICFDIVVDAHAEAMVRDGAQLILAPTNNADFGYTDQSAQQLQIARLRAIETGHAVVNISTVGTSEIVGPDGNSLDALEPHTADALLADVPLVRGITPGIAVTPRLAWAWIVLGLGGSAVGALTILRSRNKEQ
ncbi:apolipoprotein N-acyltransferase [Leucobacter sp. GX24907]